MKQITKQMKIKFFMMMAVLFLMACSGQKEEKIYDVCDEMPTFNGGDEALMKWLGENIKYPAEAEKDGKEGRVLVKFVVTSTGKPANAEILRSVDPLLDAEALRVVEAMPNWNPGKQDGKPVNVNFTLPVTFRLK